MPNPNTRKLILALLCGGWCAVAALADGGGVSAVFAQRAEENYRAAKLRFQRDIGNAEAAWQLGRACFDKADLTERDKDKEAIAQEGCYACRQGLINDPKSAWPHYYLGLNLGELASSRGLGALALLHDMQDEWKAAERLDPKIDYGGPERSLGMLYRDAPGWPLSIGSRTKAIEQLSEATRLGPNFPDNWITLAEAYLKWNEFSRAQSVTAKIPDILKQARQEFTGPAWESSWVDWTRRWQAVQDRMNETSRPQSPHEAGK